jgi:hypothetical protein
MRKFHWVCLKVSWIQKDYGGVSGKKNCYNLGYIMYLSLLNSWIATLFSVAC